MKLLKDLLKSFMDDLNDRILPSNRDGERSEPLGTLEPERSTTPDTTNDLAPVVPGPSEESNSGATS